MWRGFDDFQSATEMDTYIPMLNALFNVILTRPPHVALKVLEAIPSHLAIFMHPMRSYRGAFEQKEAATVHGFTLYQSLMKIEKKVKDNEGEVTYVFSLFEAIFDLAAFAVIKLWTLE
jgi:hypothetical protein